MTPFSDKNYFHEILYQDGDNKVLYCFECHSFHVYYGTMSFDISKCGIKSLAGHLKQLQYKYEGAIDSKSRCIEVDTPYPTIRLLLSIEDLQHLGGMLRHSYLIFEERHWKAQYN
ncbi:MAG: DUF6686 family protein [Bacteroidota bacterium]